MRFWCLGSIIKCRSIKKNAMTTTAATNFGFRATGDKSRKPRASGRCFFFFVRNSQQQIWTYQSFKSMQIHANPCKSPKVRKLMLKGFSMFTCRLTGVPIAFKGFVFALNLYTSAMLTSSLGATIFCWPWSLEAAAHSLGLRDRLVNNLSGETWGMQQTGVLEEFWHTFNF